MTEDVVELERQNRVLTAALIRCDEAAQRFWKSKTSVNADEDLEVIEAGRQAHVTLLDLKGPPLHDVAHE